MNPLGLLSWYRGLGARTHRIIVYVAVVGAFSILAAIAARQQGELSGAVEENHGLVTSLHSALVESCEVNGNAARQVTRETLHEEIASAEHPDKALVEALNIPPKTLQRITAETVAKLRERLARVKPVDCASQYRISPGSRRRAP